MLRPAPPFLPAEYANNPHKSIVLCACVWFFFPSLTPRGTAVAADGPDETASRSGSSAAPRD
ncbi:hypothetical protein E2C01_026046 [Portunus trituberculatus]|uniref:Uncharacterized protein n=1 Tax=Portunus trituberculatus TaxID=210409 RepID=A0A5B7EEG6_PORTR|nr:hypothetical protein [Portunus trituberculatus]